METVERKIRAGELENVKASEEVTRRNVQMVVQFSKETRALVIEQQERINTLQGNLMNAMNQLNETRGQLALLQQQFYSRGTTSYADGDKH